MDILTAAALVFGIMAGTLCNFATQIKFFAGYDDSLDVSVFFMMFSSSKEEAVDVYLVFSLTYTIPVDFCLSRYRRYSREHFDCYFCSTTRGFL